MRNIIKGVCTGASAMVLLTVSAISLSVNAEPAPAVSAAAQEEIDRGIEAFLNSRYDEAERLFDLARKKLKRSSSQQLDYYEEKLDLAKGFIERVERITILDSIAVPRTDFFKAYRLPLSAGMLRSGGSLGEQFEDFDYVFSNENDDYRLWAQADTTGFRRLHESNLLTDGKWSAPQVIADIPSEEEADALYPFMMSDGVTLYFASDGPESIGGLDIFVATRDAADGTFLSPQNIGMPYNSPYDDYLLAIDELNGVGWWATDRNQLDDALTVYLFKVNDLRKNYPADEENIEDFARISDYKATWEEDEDYDELLAEIRAIDPTKEALKPEFRLPASGGKVYTRFDQLPSANVRRAVQGYLNDSESLEENEARLRELRMKYKRQPVASTATQIENLEKSIDKMRADLKKTRSEMYKLLNGVR